MTSKTLHGRSKATKRVASTPPDRSTTLSVSLNVRKAIGFSRPQFARLVSISERSLAAIESGDAPSLSHARSLTQTKRLIQALSEAVSVAEIGTWMTTPNPAFEGLKPLEVIERGEIDRVWKMIYLLQSGDVF